MSVEISPIPVRTLVMGAAKVFPLVARATPVPNDLHCSWRQQSEWSEHVDRAVGAWKRQLNHCPQSPHHSTSHPSERLRLVGPRVMVGVTRKSSLPSNER